jgi:zinc transporter ZupT
MARKSTAWPPLPQMCLVVGGVVGLLFLLASTLSSLAASGSHRYAAFAMSLGAGAATGIGASFVLCTTSLDRRLLACTMAFSAGVMIYVSLVEVVHVATEHFSKGPNAMRPAAANLWGTVSLFAGVALMAAVDRVVHAIFDAVAGHGVSHAHAHGHGGSGGGGGGRGGGSGGWSGDGY